MMYGQAPARKHSRVDVRVDDETKHLLDQLAALYRSNRSHVVRLAVAELARRQGVMTPDDDVGAGGDGPPARRSTL
jgi:predicted transcriptional regulator